MSRATWRLSRPYCQSDVWRPFGASRAFRLPTAEAISGHVRVTPASRLRPRSFVRLYKQNGPVNEKTLSPIKPLLSRGPCRSLETLSAQGMEDFVFCLQNLNIGKAWV